MLNGTAIKVTNSISMLVRSHIDLCKRFDSLSPSSLFRRWTRFTADHFVSSHHCKIDLSERWSNTSQQVRKLDCNRAYILAFS